MDTNKNNEEIKNILLDRYNNNQLIVQRAIYLVEEYIYELKNKKIDINFNHNINLDLLNHFFEIACSYYATKFNMCTIIDLKTQKILKVYF